MFTYNHGSDSSKCQIHAYNRHRQNRECQVKCQSQGSNHNDILTAEVKNVDLTAVVQYFKLTFI